MGGGFCFCVWDVAAAVGMISFDRFNKSLFQCCRKTILSSGLRVSALPETLITSTTFSVDLLDSNIPLVVETVMKLAITGYSANIPLCGCSWPQAFLVKSFGFGPKWLNSAFLRRTIKKIQDSLKKKEKKKKKRCLTSRGRSFLNAIKEKYWQTVFPDPY